MRKLPTIRDVAQHAGVSLTSASYIINKKPGHKFTPETIAKVENAVEALGYTRNRMIQAIHKGKSYTIGLGNLLPGINHEKTLNGVYSELALAKSYDLLIYFSVGSQEKDRKVFLDGRADGLIFPEESGVNISEYVAQRGLPVVVFYKRDVAPGVACAKIDDIGAARTAVEYLWSKGHRRIAHLAGHINDWMDAQDRLTGYCNAMKQLSGEKVPDEWIFNRYDWTAEKCDEALAHWCSLPEASRPTAIFSANDTGAIGLMRAAEKRGIRVPENLSIIGCDNNFEAEANGLTTMHLDFAKVGQYAVQSIVDIIEGRKKPEECRTPISAVLIERSSVINI
jgi:LacI family transcriptional regulator, galactose operon repressor